jgi:DNA-binding NarL/FixJ family response regulator
VRAFLGDDQRASTVADGLSELSERECEVLTLVAAGMSNEQIADRLYLSPRTVERHLSNVYVKLRLTGKSARAAAAARFYARETRFTPSGSAPPPARTPRSR